MRIVQTYNLLDFTDAYGPVPFLSVFKTAGDPVQPSSFAYDTRRPCTRPCWRIWIRRSRV